MHIVNVQGFGYMTRAQTGWTVITRQAYRSIFKNQIKCDDLITVCVQISVTLVTGRSGRPGTHAQWPVDGGQGQGHVNVSLSSQS